MVTLFRYSTFIKSLNKEVGYKSYVLSILIRKSKYIFSMTKIT